MNQTQKIPWKRISVEAAAIVASILLAFAIDAWWDENVEDKREREILLALLDDLETSKSTIMQWRNFHVAVQASNTKLLNFSLADNPVLTEDEIDLLLSNLGWFDIRPHFTTGALNSLIFGGELAVIEDDKLRQMLADWPSQIEYVAAMQRQDYDFFLNVWTPYLRVNANLPRLAAIVAPKPGRPSDRTPDSTMQLTGTRNHSAMVADEKFHNILVQKSWIQFDILAAFDATLALLDQTIQQVKSVL
jgi:hypothetical protein